MLFMQRWLFLLVVQALFVCFANAWAQEMSSIEGILLVLDDKTPHVAVHVQAVGLAESMVRLERS